MTWGSDINQFNCIPHWYQSLSCILMATLPVILRGGWILQEEDNRCRDRGSEIWIIYIINDHLNGSQSVPGLFEAPYVALDSSSAATLGLFSGATWCSCALDLHTLRALFLNGWAYLTSGICLFVIACNLVWKRWLSTLLHIFDVFYPKFYRHDWWMSSSFH